MQNIQNIQNNPNTANFYITAQLGLFAAPAPQTAQTNPQTVVNHANPHAPAHALAALSQIGATTPAPQATPPQTSHPTLQQNTPGA